MTSHNFQVIVTFDDETMEQLIFELTMDKIPDENELVDQAMSQLTVHELSQLAKLSFCHKLTANESPCAWLAAPGRPGQIFFNVHVNLDATVARWNSIRLAKIASIVMTEA